MASVFKTQSKKISKGKARADSEDNAGAVNGASSSTAVKPNGSTTEVEKRRKDKVLMLSSRGVTQRMRHLMHDLEVLLPHVKKDSKLDSKSSLHLLNELADLHSCNNTLYFESRRHEDLYLWLSRSPNGPSVKCHVQNLHTMDELKMTGNCLRGSRGLVTFDGSWGENTGQGEAWTGLMKEMLTHIFSVPQTSRRLKPFIDHILLFSLLDGKIWFRNYQIIEKDPLPELSSVPTTTSGKGRGAPQTSLVEIGPRFVLTPIRMFEGSFGGPTLYANPEFVSPTSVRAGIKRAQGDKYKYRVQQGQEREDRGKRRREDVPEDKLARQKVFA